MTYLRKLRLPVIILTLLFVSTAIFTAPAIAADSTNLRDETFGQFDELRESAGMESEDYLPEIIATYIKYALTLMGFVLICLILYGGFLWMTAGGNEEQVKKAKRTIMNAVIGLVIIILAYGITAFVINAITATHEPYHTEGFT